MGHPRYTTEEIVRRGRELYEQQIRPRVEKGNIGKILVLDIETGDYEIDDDHLKATKRALARHPDAALYSLRIGYPTLGKIGGGWAHLVGVEADGESASRWIHPVMHPLREAGKNERDLGIGGRA